MIQQESILQVADNSGAKTVKCIKVLGGYKKKNAKLGDMIITSVQELRNKSKITSKVKKGEIYKALVIRTKKTFSKKDEGDDGNFLIFASQSLGITSRLEATFVPSSHTHPVFTLIWFARKWYGWRGHG